MKRANFQPIFEQKSDFCERTSEKPIETLIPGQAIKLSELVARFDRGQRLNVHANFPAGSNFEPHLVEETFEEAAPDDVHDVVDVQREYEQHQIHKREFAERQKKKKQTQPAPTPGEAPQVQPEDPAK